MNWKPLALLALLAGCATATPQEQAAIDTAAREEAAIIAQAQAACAAGRNDICGALVEYRQMQAVEAQQAIRARNAYVSNVLGTASNELAASQERLDHEFRPMVLCRRTALGTICQ